MQDTAETAEGREGGSGGGGAGCGMPLGPPSGVARYPGRRQSVGARECGFIEKIGVSHPDRRRGGRGGERGPWPAWGAGAEGRCGDRGRPGRSAGGGGAPSGPGNGPGDGGAGVGHPTVWARGKGLQYNTRIYREKNRGHPSSARPFRGSIVPVRGGDAARARYGEGEEGAPAAVGMQGRARQDAWACGPGVLILVPDSTSAPAWTASTRPRQGLPRATSPGRVSHVVLPFPPPCPYAGTVGGPFPSRGTTPLAPAASS